MSRLASNFILILFASLLSSGCMFVRAPSPEELHALDHPPAEIKQKVEQILPLALHWIDEVENKLLSTGRPLGKSELAAARHYGVKHPERVRIVVLDVFPMPDNDALYKEAERYGMGSSFEGGRTMGYVVLLKPAYADAFGVISHELVHVAQHDRLGREEFVRRYLVEMEMMGYSRSPLELEAYRLQGTL